MLLPLHTSNASYPSGCKELFKCVFFIDRILQQKIYLRLPIQDYVFSNIYILIQNKLTYVSL